MRETENSRRYHFADFTRENYAALIRLALEKYRPVTYGEACPAGRCVLWRHDLDFSLHAGLKLAEIEAREGMTATYFFLLHSEFYNLLERECITVARRILRFGHRLGLHFDHEFWGVRDEAGLERSLVLEKSLLEEVFHQPVEAFSFHIPDETSARYEADRYCGLVNAYSSYFKTQVGYCSDSNGYWRHRRLAEVLSEGADARLQVLTHPEYWQDSIMSPRERVERCIQGRAEKVRGWYRRVLRETGRQDIDW
jgi:hypothetical protein